MQPTCSERAKSRWNPRDLINWLRLHEVIVLQLGDEGNEKMRESLRRSGYPDYVADGIWYLSRSGLPETMIAAVRAAANHGMNRW